MNLRDLAGRITVEQRRELARRAGIEPRYLDQLISGFRNNPSLPVLRRLAAADRRLSVAHMSAEFAARPDGYAEPVPSLPRAKKPAANGAAR
jgi:transcriptional regulator with XRE-family HTH domain